MRFPPERYTSRMDRIIDRGYWLAAFLLLLGAGLFPEQIVDFWGWFIREGWLWIRSL